MKNMDQMGYLEGFIKELKVRGYSKSTILSYKNDVKQFLMHMKEGGRELKEMVRKDMKNYIYYIDRMKYKGSSLCRKMSSVKGFIRYLMREKVIQEDPILLIERPRYKKGLPCFLNQDELQEITNQCDLKNDVDIRDRMIFEILYSTGMRVSELVGIEMRNIHEEDGVIQVCGKGNKERLTFLTERCQEILKLYKKVRSKWLIKTKEETKEETKKKYLLIKDNGNPIKTWDIWYIIRKRSKNLKLKRKIGPHTFRHSFATHLLDNGADIRAVQELLGHKDLSSTQIYTHVSRSKLKKVYEQSHPHAK